MQDAVLALPMDMEDLGKLGRRKEVCPYYAARAALPQADLVLLPYAALLLQASSHISSNCSSMLLLHCDQSMNPLPLKPKSQAC
jgi:hypothetical protein